MTTTKNWMLEETVTTIQEQNCPYEYEMVKKLTIQKIEYGRICMNQLLAGGGQTLQTIAHFHKELDNELQKRIDEVNNFDFDFL